MRKPGTPLAVAVVAAVFMQAGCYGFLPAPAHVDREKEAAVQERKRCTPPPADARLFTPEVVESVEPYILHVNSGNGREARMHGAELRLRPLPGMTPELVAHDLECHSAELVLGRAPGTARPDDPYFLPDGWVKISVRSDDAGFVVALDGEDIEQAKEILARARTFTGAR